MPLFSSPRERRLWLWTLVIVLSIYLTLGIAGSWAFLLAEPFRHTGLNFILFLLGCLLVLGTVVTQGLKRWPSTGEISIALGIAAAYLMVFVRMASPIERSHLVEYGVVAAFIFEALSERARQGQKVPVPALLAILISSLIGLIDECLQLMIPNRVFDPIDILFNALASFMAVAGSIALTWARRTFAQPGKQAPEDDS